MIRTLGWQSSFNAGEIDPLLYGRIDITRYLKAARVLENKVPLVQGAASRRPGTLDVAAIKDQAQQARLAEFDFGDVDDTTQSYVLEAGAGYLRIHDPVTGLLTTAASNLAITNQDFTSNLTGWTVTNAALGTATQSAGQALLRTEGPGDSAAIDQQISGTGSTTHVISFKTGISDVLVKIGTSHHAADIIDTVRPPGVHTLQFTMPAGGSCYLEFKVETTGLLTTIDYVRPMNAAVIDLAAPWTLADLDRAQRAGSFDTQFIATGGHRAQELRRYDTLSWSLVDAVLDDGPYLPENTNLLHTVSVRDKAGNVIGAGVVPPDSYVKVTFSHAHLDPATNVNRWLRLGASNKWGCVRLFEITSTTVAFGQVVKYLYADDFSAGVTGWRLGAFHGASFPRSVSFYDNRLAFGGCDERPQTAYLSRPELVRDFAPSERPTNDANEDVIDATSALTFTPASRRRSPIVWLHGGRALYIGTTGGPYSLDSGRSDLAIGPTNVRAQKLHGVGCGPRAPAEARDALLYPVRQRTGFNALGIQSSTENVVSDLSLLSPSLLNAKMATIHWQEKPWSVAWFHDDDGQLFSFTFDNTQEVTAFARHPLGGDGIVESLAIITRPDGDELWLIVRRTVNGATTRRIEKLALPWQPKHGAVWHHADAGKVVDRWNTNTAKTIATGGTTGAYTLTANDAANIAGVTTGGKVLLKRLLREDKRAGGRRWYEHIIVDIASAASSTVLNVSGTLPESWRGQTFTMWAIGATTVTGLSHLEGLAVVINRDGVPEGPYTVTAGAITGLTAYGFVSVGLAYTSIAEPVTLERQLADGTSAARSRQSGQFTARLVDTLGGHFGNPAGHMDPIKYAEISAGVQRQHWSGDIVLTTSEGWSAMSTFRLEQRANAPMTIAGLGDVAMIAEPNAAIPAGSI